MKGIIKMVNLARGFGFIKGDDGKEYFFHMDNFNGFFETLAKDLAKETIKVNFVIVPSQKGPRAEEVTRLENNV